MRTTVTVHGAWAAIFILFAALCTLSVFSARDAREAVADPAKAESDSSVYYSPNDAASQETDRESAANSANFKEYETFFTVRAYNGSVAVFKDGNDVPLYCIETPLSSLTEEDRRLLAAQRLAMQRLVQHFGPDTVTVAQGLLAARSITQYLAALDGIQAKLAIYMGRKQAEREVQELRIAP